MEAGLPETYSARLIRFSKWLVFSAAFIPAVGALTADFYWIDDRSMIVNNPLATGPLSWKLFSEPHFSHYSPLHELLIWTQWHLFGNHAFGFRVVSLLLHAGASLACLTMLRNLTGRPLLALGATLIWAVHPIHAESVDWITEQKTLWCGLCCFWALAIYFDRERSRASRVILAIVLMAIGSLGKSHGLYVGPVILLYELCGLSGAAIGAGLVNSIPFLILTAVFAKLALKGNEYTESIAHWTLRDTLLNLPSTLLIYLRTAFLPWTASFFQEMERVTEFSSASFWAVLLALFWVFAAGCAAVKSASRRLFVFLALAWGAALGPMLNVSQTTFPAYDRFQYVALPFLIVGAALMIEGALRLLTAKAPAANSTSFYPILWAAVLAVVAVCGLKRGLLFASEANVMADAVNKAPTNACAPAQLANTLYPEWERANSEFQRTRDSESFNERQMLARTIGKAVRSAQACPNFADFYVTPVPLLKMAGKVLHESAFVDEAIPLLEAAIAEPRWERFKADREQVKRTLAIIALETAQARINESLVRGTTVEVEQDLAGLALEQVERSRELFGASEIGSWLECKAHIILLRCFRKKNQPADAKRQLHALESALNQIPPASNYFKEVSGALEELKQQN
jgi:hypothetical protein